MPGGPGDNNLQDQWSQPTGGSLDVRTDDLDFVHWRDRFGSKAGNLSLQAHTDFIEINHAETSAILSSQLLANDCNPSREPLVVVGISEDVGGTAELRDGVIFFTPNSNHDHHPMSFRYQVASGGGAIAAGMVHLEMRPPMHGGTHDHARAEEHMALFALVDTADVTNVAIRSGAWSDPTIWSSSSVPGSGERVLIHETASVRYDVVSDEPLDWLRVDGIWNVAHDIATRIVVETIVSSPMGTINVGTSSQPINPRILAEILIDTSGGPLSQSTDPRLLGRGFIGHGETNFYGAPKKEFTTLAVDATAGAAFIDISDTAPPDGWQIGDTLLLAGTEANAGLLGQSYDPNRPAEIIAADATNSRFRDELLEVTDMSVIDGRTRITFLNVTNESAIKQGRTTLLWNHQRPSGATFDRNELSIHVANLTRNVVIRSNDPTVDIQQRGHFMVMHNVNTNIHHAQFKDLGRSDKRRIVDDPAAIGNLDGSPGSGTNPRGRYGLHLHKTGVSSLTGPSAMVTGNVVWGAPGWGIVQHASHATLEDNVVFDIAGAGIVAEEGNELGLWRNNLVVKTTGDLVNNYDDNPFFQTLRGPRFDLGFVGSGYWVQGGGFGIRLEGNIAASTNAAGFDLVHMTDGLALVPQLSTELIEDPVVREAIEAAGFSTVTPNNIPTRGIDGLEAYNGFRGIHTWLHNRNSQSMEGRFTFLTRLAHDFRSVIQNYRIWGVLSGIQNFYSTRFDFIDGLVIGDVETPVPFVAAGDQQGNNSRGIGAGHNHNDANSIAFRGLRLEGFEYGFQVFSPFNDLQQAMSPYAFSELERASIANVRHAFLPTSSCFVCSSNDRFSDLFVIDDASTFNALDSATNIPPTAAFSFTAGAGLSVKLDASPSLDSDPSPQVRPGDDGIAAYAWDLDGDGVFDDAYGLRVTLTPDAPGIYPIGLKVWDDNGAVATTTQLVTVTAQPYNNPWVDGDFSGSGPFGDQHYNIWSSRRGHGWIARDVIRNPDGFAEIGSPQHGLGGLVQLIRDEHVRRGKQIFSFEAINLNVAGATNGLRLRLFGVDGQWRLVGGAPSQIYASTAPMVTTLIDINMGAMDIPNWQTMIYDVNLGKRGFEYLVVNVEYVNYNTSQGDYFALDDFQLTDLAPESKFRLSDGRPSATLSPIELPPFTFFPFAESGPDRLPALKSPAAETALQFEELAQSSESQAALRLPIDSQRRLRTSALSDSDVLTHAGNWRDRVDSLFADSEGLGQQLLSVRTGWA